MEVNQEVDKEVTKVVELVNKGLALVCRYGDGQRDDFSKTIKGPTHQASAWGLV